MPNPFLEKASIAPVEYEPILVEINARMVPLLLRALDRYKYRKSWITDTDFTLGVQQVNVLEIALLTGTQTIVDAIDRVYRLMDTTLNGASYVASVDSPPIVTPAIPDAPAVNDLGGDYGIRRALNDQTGVLYNLAMGLAWDSGNSSPVNVTTTETESIQAQLRAVQGTINPGWFGIGGQPATLADLVTSVRAGSDADIERVTSVLDVLVGAGSSASVFNAVRGLLTDTAQLGAEGGILAVLVASTMSQAALMGLQGGQLDTLIARIDRLIASLDGGLEPRPASNVLTELENAVTKLQ